MLTRLVRIQLAVFAIASTVGIVAMAFVYLQVPLLLGVGRITVKLELPAAGGLYRFANVTYRGVTIGKVTAVDLTDDGAEATMSLAARPRVPADLRADVRSMSAVGEQYVDLLPRSDTRGYLEDGSVIPASNASIPQPVGPMLDHVSALLGSIPKDRLSTLLNETFTGLNGAGDDLETIVNGTSTLAREFNGASDQSKALIDDAGPLLDGQVQSADATRSWAHGLAGITDTLASDDHQVRHIFESGPVLTQDVSQLLTRLKPTLPVLLANLASLGQVGVTYRPGLEQLLVRLPPSASYYQAERPVNNPTGQVVGDFRVAVDDPPGCTIGFLPASQWRSPADTSEIDTPDGLYCKLPQDSPIAVRGARNLPCMGHPGKRAPTVAICDSDQPYEPLAMRQHAIGPPPFDPNLVANGIAVDDRVPGQRGLFAPVEGTPMPQSAGTQNLPSTVPGADMNSTALPNGVPTNPLLPSALQVQGPPDVPPPSAVPPPGDSAGVAGNSPEATPTAPDPGAASGPDVPAVAPSAFHGEAPGVPSVAVAQYDPRTGRYLAPDGQMAKQSNLVDHQPKRWQDLVLQS
jgi:phospholipid/cholesterol/gamma-HCH transport system substrate-binding protein